MRENFLHSILMNIKTTKGYNDLSGSQTDSTQIEIQDHKLFTG